MSDFETKLTELNQTIGRVANPLGEDYGPIVLRPIQDSIITQYAENCQSEIVSEVREKMPKSPANNLLGYMGHVTKHGNKNDFHKYNYCSKYDNLGALIVGLGQWLFGASLGMTLTEYIWGWGGNIFKLFSILITLCLFLAWLLPALDVWWHYKGVKNHIEKEAITNAESRMMDKVMKLRNEPVFLINEVKAYLNQIAIQCRNQFFDLEVEFKKVTVEVREQARRSIIELGAQRKFVEGNARGSQQKTLLDIIERCLTAYKIIAEEVPNEHEEKLITLFRQVGENLRLFQDSVNGLEQVKTYYQSIEETTASIEKHVGYIEELKLVRRESHAEIEFGLQRIQEFVMAARNGIEDIRRILPISGIVHNQKMLPEIIST